MFECLSKDGVGSSGGDTLSLSEVWESVRCWRIFFSIIFYKIAAGGRGDVWAVTAERSGC